MTSEKTLTEISLFHPDLKILRNVIYDRCSFSLTNFELSKESVEYGACSFELNGKSVLHRVSKITPIKSGQFVSIWKRSEDGLTKPYDSFDNIDFIIITVRRGEDFGQFVFPKLILMDRGIISFNSKNGKRGIRVYPPWDIVTNKQAEKTQSWQVKYFLDVNDVLTDRVRQLF